MLVVGVDVWKGRWLAVALEGGVFAGAMVAESLAEATARYASSLVFGIDIPIGLPTSGRRQADEAVRPFIASRRASVFFAPPADVVREPTYQRALAVSRQRHGFGISAQAYALSSRIIEADDVARSDDRVFEVHPEVSFRQMSGNPLDHPKRSWNGQMERRRLLTRHGIRIPDQLGDAGAAAPDDVLDAAAAAWSAHRIADGNARCFPDPPQRLGDYDAAIWC